MSPASPDGPSGSGTGPGLGALLAPLVAIVSGAVLLCGVVGLVAWLHSRPPGDVPLAAVATRAGGPTATPAVGVTAVPSPATSSLALSTLGKAARDDPRTLRVSSQQIAGPVVAVGTDPATGALRVPDVTTRIAWWSYGSRPGDPTGPVVLAAHVDYNGKLGLFYRLDRVAIGSTVSVTRRNGSTVTYRVVSRQHIAKRSLGSLHLFDLGGQPRLVLITCGGSFDAAVRSYRDNIIVTARPVA